MWSRREFLTYWSEPWVDRSRKWGTEGSWGDHWWRQAPKPMQSGKEVGHPVKLGQGGEQWGSHQWWVGGMRKSADKTYGGWGAEGCLNTQLMLRKVGDGQEGGKAKTQHSQARHGCYQPTFRIVFHLCNDETNLPNQVVLPIFNLKDVNQSFPCVYTNKY